VERFCELHVHLEGCVWPRHVRNWWARSELRFPFPRTGRGAPFGVFLERLRYGYNFLNTATAYAEVAVLYAEQAAAQGIRYAELQINLALLDAWGFALPDVLDRVNERVAGVDQAPTLRFIADLPWQFDATRLGPVVAAASGLQARGLRGISFGGREDAARPDAVAPACADARAAGLKVLCHAGETADTDLARRIVETLQPARVAHGVTIADWIAALGAAAPAIDVCLTSNVALGVVGDLTEHPLPRWWDAGVTLCLSTDDPAVFATTLGREHALAARLCPALATDRTRRVAHWLRAALDPAAAAEALGVAAD
jgi:adenosine deaminase